MTSVFTDDQCLLILEHIYLLTFLPVTLMVSREVRYTISAALWSLIRFYNLLNPYHFRAICFQLMAVVFPVKLLAPITGLEKYAVNAINALLHTPYNQAHWSSDQCRFDGLLHLPWFEPKSRGLIQTWRPITRGWVWQVVIRTKNVIWFEPKSFLSSCFWLVTCFLAFSGSNQARQKQGPTHTVRQRSVQGRLV